MEAELMVFISVNWPAISN